MKLLLMGDIFEVNSCVSHLQDKMDINITEDGIKVLVSKKGSGGLQVKKDNNGYSIAYGIIPDFCRALCILIDKIKNEDGDFEINEDRKIERCGIMADVSRNAVLKVSAVKDIISRIARMGMNTFMLYMEDVYKIEGYEYFGYMRGAYSQDELKEIDAYAKDFGIEVVASIQTLAHLTSTLRWPYANGMKDTADVLLVGEQKTYEFIDKMIGAISGGLSSSRIHIGMDEAWGLGTGVYKRKHGDVDRFKIMENHLNKVVEIANKYGKEPIMWSDMFFRIGSKTGMYYDTEAEMPENISELIPKGITMAYWDYYNSDINVYNSMIKNHQKMGRNIAFFGGIWTWNGMAINYDKTFRTTQPAMKSCRENNINEICATLWRDDGGEIDIYTALLGMQLYSEYVYYDDVSEEHLSKMFRICTGYNAQSFINLDFDNLHENDKYKNTPEEVHMSVAAAKQVFYQDILQGLFDKQYENIKLKEHYEKRYKNLISAEIPTDLVELFEYFTQFAHVLYLKCDIGRRITENYKKSDKAALLINCKEIVELYSEICVLHEKFSALWLKNNKAFGLDRIDLRFGGLKERLNRAKTRIEAFLNNRIECIEELEEEKLKFSDYEFPPERYYKSFILASIG